MNSKANQVVLYATNVAFGCFSQHVWERFGGGPIAKVRRPEDGGFGQIRGADMPITRKMSMIPSDLHATNKYGSTAFA
jgi:hypothetical protein